MQKELKDGKLEDELACTRLPYVARAARLAPPHLLAMLQSGDDVKIRSVGRHGEYASATCTQVRRAQATYRDGSAMGGRWPGQWQLMVTRFAEKRMEQMSAGACRVRVAASSYAHAETTFRHSGD